VFNKKRPNSFAEAPSVSITISVNFYATNSNSKAMDQNKVGFKEYKALSESDITDAILGINVKKYNYMRDCKSPLYTVIEVVGRIGKKEVNIRVNNTPELIKEMSKFNVKEPVYENWALKLRRI
jgi:hypothetical protein